MSGRVAQCVALTLWIAMSAGCATAAAKQCIADTTPAAAAALWHENDVSNYQFVWQQSCFCLPEAVQPIRITVTGGAITAATNLAGQPIPEDVRENLLTIDGLYRRLLDADADAGAATVRFSCIDAGIPQQIFIDPDARVADDEFRVTLSAFEVTR